MIDRRKLILELCHEAGETATDDEILQDWEADHACCCSLHAANAALGDIATLNNIRACMGLVLKQKKKNSRQYSK